MNQAAATFLDKAERSLSAAQLLFEAGSPDIAASRAYYVMLYAADAMLAQAGERHSDHPSSHAAFAERFVATGLVDASFHARLVAAWERRLVADYGIDAPFPTREALQLMDEARAFLAVARAHLKRAPA